MATYMIPSFQIPTQAPHPVDCGGMHDRPDARAAGRLVGWLFAAATDGELDADAQAHEAQARQLRDPAVRAALRGAWQVVDPLRFIPGRHDLGAPLVDLLELAPAELARRARAELRAAGLDPDALGWPPPRPVVG